MNETIKKQFVEAFVETFQDPEIGRKYNEFLDAQIKARELDDEGLKRRIQEWGESLIPDVEKRIDQKLAQATFTPPEPRELESTKTWTTWAPPKELLQRDARDEEELAIQKIHDRLMLLNAMLRDDKGRIRRDIAGPVVERWARTLDLPEHVKTLVTGTTGGAYEWVSQIMSADFYRKIMDKTVIAQQFPTLTMTAQYVTIPSISGDPDVYAVPPSGEGQAVTEDASIASASVSLNAKMLKARRRWSDELDADSILSVADALAERLQYGMARALDMAIDNGSAAQNHHDSDITNTNDPRRQWNGLRAKALADTGANVDLSTFNLNNLLSIPGLMGRYADPTQLVFILHNRTFWTKLPTLADSNGNPVFLPGAFGGTQGPVLEGMTNVRIMGIPVIVSSLKRHNLDATGKYSSTGTYTTLEVVNKSCWILGVRKEVTVETDRDIENGVRSIVVTWRGDFKHLEGTNLSTAMGLKIS